MPLETILGAFFIIGTNSGTKSKDEETDFGLQMDHKKDLPFKSAVLRNRGGDLSKEWYVEFYAYDEAADSLTRKRKKIPMSYTDKKSRTKAGNELIAKINALLKRGAHFKVKKVNKDTQGTTEESDLVQSLKQVLEVTSSVMAPKSVLTYQSAINKLESYFEGGKVTISNFDKMASINFRDYLLTTLRNNPRTANNTVQHLAVLYSKLQLRSKLPENPFKAKPLAKTTSKNNVAFSKDDQKKVEDYLKEKEPEVYLFTRFIYYAFIRPGELIKIRLSAVNIEQKYITITGHISKNNKTETAQIIPPLEKLIHDSRIIQNNTNYFLFGKSLVPGLQEVGKQVAFRRHEKALKALGLIDKGYTLYSWKHTGAVNAYLAGVGIKELQRMLRHSSIQITDIYLRSLGLRTDPNLDKYSW